MRMKRLGHLILATLIVFGTILFNVPSAAAAYGDVSAYAGKPYGGDGGSRLNAYFDFPRDIDRDSSGNFYIADTYNNVIRKISSGGTVSTLAGSGSYGDATGSATSAQFALPSGVAVGSDSSVYVADTNNGKIKKIASGSVSTLASGLSGPQGVVPYGSTLYFTDTGNGAIKKVSTSGGTVTTVASGLSDPRRMDIATDGSQLYVAENGKHRVIAVNTTSGSVAVVAGSGTSGYKEGTGTSAQFEQVWSVTLDGSYLYVTDHDDWIVDRVRKINIATNQTSLIYQDTRQNELIYPSGITTDSTYVYVVNAGLGTVHRFSKTDGSNNSLFAGADRFGNLNGSVTSALFGRPYDITMSADGQTLYIADNNKIRKIDVASGTVSHVIGSSVDNYRGEGTDYDSLPVRFSTIQSITMNSTGTRLYVVDRWNNRIRGINLQASPVSTFLVTGAGLINTTGASDNGYAEGTRCSETVQTTGVAGCAYFRGPSGIVISPDNQYLYVSDTGNNKIRKVRISDGQTWLVAGSSAGFKNGVGSAAQFNKPFGLTIDSTGNTLYVADTNNHSIRRIDLTSNTVSLLAGNGTIGYREAIGTDARLSYPEYVKMGSDGLLYFSEGGSQRVRQVNPATGLTKLIAGSGTTGFKNGGQTTAQFNGPKGLAPDPSHSVMYVADTFNDTIRRIDLTGTAPYANPAPTVTSVSPNAVNPAWDNGSGLQVAVQGTNFLYGLVTYFGDIPAEKTYVQSGTSLAVKLPLSQMSPGWYDVTVKNLDGQIQTLERGLGITDSAGTVPGDYYPYSGKTSGTISGPPIAAAASQFFPYDSSLRGGFFSAAGNVTGDSRDEIVTGTGVGFAPQVRVFDEQGNLKSQFFAYATTLRTGVRVSACDVTGDGTDEIVTVPGAGGAPHVRIFNADGTPRTAGFFALDGKFKGGAFLSCGDTDGDGTQEIVVAADQGGGPHVLVYNKDGKILTNFMAYDPGFRGGITVTTADMDGDGRDEIITGPRFGSPHIQIFQIRPNELKRLSPGFLAFNRDYKGGVTVTGVDTDGDGTKELVVGVGESATPFVKIFNIREEWQKEFYVYSTAFTGGLQLSGGDVDGDGADELLVLPRGGGGPNLRVINVDEI